MRFSQRHNIKLAKPLQVNTLDLETRIKIHNYIHLFITKLNRFSKNKLITSLKCDFFVMDFNTKSSNVFHSLKITIRNDDWYVIYDLIEFILETMSESPYMSKKYVKTFRKGINDIFYIENVAYKLLDNHMIFSPPEGNEEAAKAAGVIPIKDIKKQPLITPSAKEYVPLEPPSKPDLITRLIVTIAVLVLDGFDWIKALFKEKTLHNDLVSSPYVPMYTENDYDINSQVQYLDKTNVK